MTVRVRFAPSPTGALHIGGVRTALYNYLFAKKHQGTFVLRIEDTDQKRYVKGAEDYIFESLKWLGISPEESAQQEGEFAPYRQSERKHLYRKYALQLVEEGKAYYAFDTAQELEQMRQELEQAKVKNTSYNAITRKKMTNAFTLSEDEVRQKIDDGEDYVIRIKMPVKEEIRFEDMVRGWVKFHSSVLDDKVLYKSDGMPTYHLANVVDDYHMRISHVIRGEEWLPSTPLHVLLYQYLGWESTMPKFAHLPLIFNPNGKGKLSKRRAAELGFPVFPIDWQFETEAVEGFREQGYLPEALLNFLALQGWNPGTEEEIFSLEELVESFDMAQVNKAGTRFDIEKLYWFNQQYIKEKSLEDILPQLKKDLANNGVADKFTEKEYQVIFDLMKERITFPQDIWENAAFFFTPPKSYDEKTVRKKWNDTGKDFLMAFKEELKDLDVWTAENIKSIQSNLVEKKEVKMGKVMPAVRLAITGLGGGPDLMTTIAIIGKAETLSRIDTAIKSLT